MVTRGLDWKVPCFYFAIRPVLRIIIIIWGILLGKESLGLFSSVGKKLYEKTGILPLRAIAAAFVKLLRKTTAKLKISKSHLLRCGKLGGMQCLLLLTDIFFRSVSASLLSFVTRFSKFSHWEKAAKLSEI